MKKALLVGINYPGTQYALKGCINDITEISKLLTSRYGFEAKNKRMLTNTSATASNILNRLDWLVTDSKPGDVLYFHYSGHGSQVISSIDEHNSKYDVLVPIDIDWKTNVITYYDLFKIFNKVSEGVNLTIVLDCCHSGGEHMTITEKGNVRFLIPPIDITENSIYSNKIKPIPENAGVIISGCRSDQKSADAWIHNKYMGVATFCLIETLKKQKTYKKIVEEMTSYMQRRGYTQRPQLEGNEYYYNHEFLQPLNIVSSEASTEISHEVPQVVDLQPVKPNVTKEELQIKLDLIKYELEQLQILIDLY